MLFASPWYLLGALGAALPILLHLYGRRRARRVPFPSLRLLQAAQRERTSLVRLRQLWLMIMRTLAILLLSLGLSRPTLPWVRVASDPERAVSLLLDDTLSMRTKAGQTRFEVARRAADDLLARLPSAAPVALLRASAPATVLHGSPRELREQLAAWQPSFSAADFPRLLGDLPAGNGRRQLYVLTDLQASNWSSAAGLSAEDRVTVVDCGQELSNHAAAGLIVSEPPALAGRPLQLAVPVRQYGKPTAAEVRVRLGQGGLPPQTVAAIERTQALLDWQPEQAGQVAASAALTPDALREDDVAYAALDVHRRLSVSLLGTAEQTHFVRLALAPDPTAGVSINASPPTPQTEAALVWTPETGGSLRRYAAGGGGLIVFAGALTQPQADGLLGAGQLRLGAFHVAATPMSIANFEIFRLPLRPFANPAAGDLKEPGFRRYRELSLPAQSALQLLASYEDGTPALLGGTVERGRVLLANFGVGPEDGDLVRQPVFVPLVHRLVGYVARRPWAALEEATTGSDLLLAPPPDATAPTAGGPGGKRLEVRVEAQGWHLRPLEPGVYRLQWQQAGRTETRLFAVNGDPLESDPARLTPTQLRELLKPATVGLVRPAEIARSRPRAALSLATPLLLLAFLLLLAEAALTLAGRTRGPNERATQP